MKDTTKLKWEATKTIPQSLKVAIRDSRRCLNIGEEVFFYQFETGKWSWASRNSPIGQQLLTDGHIYPTVKAVQWFISHV